MKLKNWHKFLENLSYGITDATSVVDWTGKEIKPYVSTSGSNKYYGRCMNTLDTSYNFGRTQKASETINETTGTFPAFGMPVGFVVGYETADVTEDDYTLSYEVDSSVNKTVSVYRNFSDDFIHAAVIIYNNTDSDITFNTIGMHCYVFTDLASSAASEDYTEETSLVRSVLLTKDKFADVTLKPNDAVIFTIKID